MHSCCCLSTHKCKNILDVFWQKCKQGDWLAQGICNRYRAFHLCLVSRTSFPSGAHFVACEKRAGGGPSSVSCVCLRKPHDLGLISLFVGSPHRGAVMSWCLLCRDKTHWLHKGNWSQRRWSCFCPLTSSQSLAICRKANHDHEFAYKTVMKAL